MLNLFIFLCIIIAPIAFIAVIYNKMIHKRNLATEGWHGIGIQLQRRYDLIPALKDVVSGYAKHESDVLERVTSLRNLVSRDARIDEAENQLQLSSTLKSLFAVTENYPDLKANANFLQLQKALEDIEDYIQNARRYYNATVREYNSYISFFPMNIFANIFKFQEKEFFGSDDV